MKTLPVHHLDFLSLQLSYLMNSLTEYSRFLPITQHLCILWPTVWDTIPNFFLKTPTWLFSPQCSFVSHTLRWSPHNTFQSRYYVMSILCPLSSVSLNKLHFWAILLSPSNHFVLGLLLLWWETKIKTNLERKGFMWLIFPYCCSPWKKVSTGT